MGGLKNVIVTLQVTKIIFLSFPVSHKYKSESEELICLRLKLSLIFAVLIAT